MDKASLDRYLNHLGDRDDMTMYRNFLINDTEGQSLLSNFPEIALLSVELCKNINNLDVNDPCYEKVLTRILELVKIKALLMKEERLFLAKEKQAINIETLSNMADNFCNAIERHVQSETTVAKILHDIHNEVANVTGKK